MDWNEIGLEFMEQEPEARLTPREALLLGVPSDREGLVLDGDGTALLLAGLD